QHRIAGGLSEAASGDREARDAGRVRLGIAVDEIERQVPVAAVEAERARIDVDPDRGRANLEHQQQSGGQEAPARERIDPHFLAPPVASDRSRTFCTLSKNRARPILIGRSNTYKRVPAGL